MCVKLLNKKNGGLKRRSRMSTVAAAVVVSTAGAIAPGGKGKGKDVNVLGLVS